MENPIEININLDALRHNLQRVKDYAPKSKVLAMIKANAYGHGMLRCAKALHDADALGVARFQKAWELRKAGIESRVVLMQGFYSLAQLELAAELNLDAVLHHPHQLTLLETARLKKPITAWLKINTGMNRLGFPAEGIEEVYQRLMSLDNVAKPINLMTHFAWANVSEHAETLRQLNEFYQAIKNLQGECSLAKSGAIIANPETHADWVRPGIMLYGVSPFENTIGAEFNLQPVMTVKSRLIAVREQQANDAIGYNATWVCPEKMPVGVVAIGYGDGYPLDAKPGTKILVNDRICQLVGRVSMDMLSVDLRNAPQAKVGDQVTLWGEELPVEQVAASAGTIPYELLTRMGQRENVVTSTRNDIKQNSEEMANSAGHDKGMPNSMAK